MSGKSIYSDEKRKEIMEKVGLLMQEGKSKGAACKEAGIDPATYAGWCFKLTGSYSGSIKTPIKGSYNYKKIVPVSPAASETPQKKNNLVMIIGSSEEIRDLLGGIRL